MFRLSTVVATTTSTTTRTLLSGNSAYHQKISFRNFRQSVRLLKDEKREHSLKNLGLSLQKGAVNEKSAKKNKDGNEGEDSEKGSTSEENSNKKETDEECNDVQDFPSQEILMKRLEEIYDISSSMSKEEFFLQIALDGDKPFLSFTSNDLINRRKILHDLPSTLNIFNLDEMDKVEEIYSKLNQLDSDKSMQLKYLKGYFADYQNDLVLLEQHLKGIDSKFKQMRRKEVTKFNPFATLLEHVSDKLNHPYNVVGFDRSLFGFPLQKERLERVFPREFIQDLPTFGDTVTLKKMDVNLEPRDNFVLDLSPSQAIPLQELVDKYHQMEPTDLKEGQEYPLVHGLYNNGDAPKEYVVLKNCASYQQVKLRDTNSQLKVIIKIIEQDIRTKQKSLDDQIKASLQTDNVAVLMPEQPTSPSNIKTDLYQVCVTKPFLQDLAWTVTLVVVKNFNILPNFVVFSRRRFSTKLSRRLKNHLYKVFLINLQPQIEQLKKIKYVTEQAQYEFNRDIEKRIDYLINRKLKGYFRSYFQNDHGTKSNGNYQGFGYFTEDNFKHKPKRNHAVLFEPYIDRCFKRIYWISTHNRSIRRTYSKSLRRSGKYIRNTKVDQNFLRV
ncbi:predicted protein [Candida tropicalis MYA-3404]|uniref:Uncharacterized protein n=1 Tax=Candida tropicalis (strain ATCC MYA-3404 / T1) TaxID=294747 RepID=C5M8I1_CANTT|nr:predicted protein [Candida tropicalis MYA-3404]EER33885.1 predicted protein [Candida tropicalis MYA-3404]KAG4407741.1 hypothetical protein JTP64_003276 [Candida tropicalis]